MRVTANGHTHTATVAANGTWSVGFTQLQLPGSDFRQVPVQITSTDVNGNVSGALNTLISIDTVANAIGVSSVGGDGTVNLFESQNGFTAVGTSVPGATLLVTIGGATQTIVVPGTGQWSAAFAGGVVSQNGFANMTVECPRRVSSLNVNAWSAFGL